MRRSTKRNARDAIAFEEPDEKKFLSRGRKSLRSQLPRAYCACVMSEQAAFGSRLREQRERRDLSLAALAESTKIAQSLLAALERGDVSGWPPGIYRRAFLRVYASAIGLSPDASVAEFVRLFPESDAAAAPRIEMPDPPPLRLPLPPAPPWPVRPLFFQAAAAAIDAAFVPPLSSGFNRLRGAASWTAAAIFAVV